MQVTLLSGPSPNARSGHIAAWGWFQLREQSSSCWELAAAQVSAVFLAPCLLQALTRGAWPRKQLSPHLQEEMQPPQPPPPPALGPNNYHIPAGSCRGKMDCWITPEHARAEGLCLGQASKGMVWQAEALACPLWQAAWGPELARESDLVRMFKSQGPNQIPDIVLDILCRIALRYPFPKQKFWFWLWKSKIVGWKIAESTGGWQVISKFTDFQESSQHNRIMKMK